MREHEVPTHVQAEDKALLWFTFPQIVAVVATCAVAYGVYRYFPFGPSGLKLGIAILLGVHGHRHDRGQGGRAGAAPGGRRPAEVQPGRPALRRVPGRAGHQRAAAPARCQARPAAAAGEEGGGQGGQRGEGRPAVRGGRPLPAPQLVRQGPAPPGRRRPAVPAPGELPGRRNRVRRRAGSWSRFLAVAALGLLAVVLLPSSALADDPDDNPYGDAWRLGEIYFEPPDPVPGRRIYVEKLAVSGDTAAVTLRAAHDLDLKGRVFGGRTGRTLKMGFNTSLAVRSEQELQPDPERPVAVVHLLLAGRPGIFRRGVAEEPPDSIPPALG